MLLSLAITAAFTYSISADDFPARFHQVKSLDVDTVGQEKVRAEMEKLISDFDSDPRVGEAMFFLACRCDCSPSERRDWLARAAARTPLGSKLWKQVQFALAEENKELRPNEAHVILDVLESHSAGDNITLARVVFVRQFAWQHSGDLAKAEDCCRHLYCWLDDFGRRPEDPDEVQQIVFLQRESAIAYMGAVATTWTLPKKKRIERITAFASTRSSDWRLVKRMNEFVDEINRGPEAEDRQETPGPKATLRDDPPPPVEPERRSPWLLVAAIGLTLTAVAMVSLLVIRLRKQSRTKGAP